MSSTNEKELAIQMWEEVKEAIENDSGVFVQRVKSTFCKKHRLQWKCHCILCEHFMDEIEPCSSKCPLMAKALRENPNTWWFRIGCTSEIESDYKIATNEDNYKDYSLAERLKAIDNIIQAIKEADLEENN